MALWVVRTGDKGQFETFSFGNNVAGIGWEHMSDLSDIQDKKTLKQRVHSAYEDREKQKLCIGRSNCGISLLGLLDVEYTMRLAYETSC